MGFQHESGHEAIRFQPQGVNGVTALDGYLLKFSVSFTLGAWRGEFGSVPSVFHSFHVRAELEPSRLRLGNPIAEVPLVVATHEHDQSGGLGFELLVPASTIEKIEELRAGGGVDIRMRIGGERVGERHATQYDELYYRISQSQWVDALKQMNYGNYLLCEIPIELGENDELREVWRGMNSARELLYNGHYGSVVVECRKALETVVKQFGLDSEIRASSKKYQGNYDERASMSKRERLLNLVNAANHVTHLGAHPDSDNRAVDYSRKEALLIFSAIAAAIAKFSEDAKIASHDE